MDNIHIDILSDLVKLETITPHGRPAINYCSQFLKTIGFQCFDLDFNGIANLYARFGNMEKNLCFAGHVDIVPPGGDWKMPPFVLTKKNGHLYGRGTNDMKGPLAACLAAVRDFCACNSHSISLSVLLTSDEEIMGENGTNRIVSFLLDNNEKLDGCILCESCCPHDVSGSYIKIGCRGSLNVDFLSRGAQCHIINGKICGNHLQKFLFFLNALLNEKLDSGTEKFPPSSMEITSIDVGN
ncbi:MAG: M20/M25/M40 family metallo-hydrolase, partial [Holosporales bacterium]|nr:M20/M25/M40 family metallo-hydrolase [Holosporales bacterium]